MRNNDYKNDLEDNDTKSYNISIEKKNTKSNIRIGTKLIIYLIIAGVSGAFFSNIVTDHKYSTIIQEYKKNVLDNDMIIKDYSKVASLVKDSIVSIGTVESLSKTGKLNNNYSGVVLDKSGIIITTYTAIEGKDKVFVKVNYTDDNIIEGKVILSNKEQDLVMIKVNAPFDLKPIKLAEIGSNLIGQEILIIGNVAYKDSIDSINSGIITSKYHLDIKNNKKLNMIQVSAPINKLNTGGPICNSKGELVALASLNLSKRSDIEGIYQGIDILELKNMMSSTRKFKDILGIRQGGVLPDNDANFKGFYIEEVIKNGGSYNAGIKPTDIILEVDNEEVRSIEELSLLVENRKNKSFVKCKVLSDGKIKEIDIKIQE